MKKAPSLSVSGRQTFVRPAPEHHFLKVENDPGACAKIVLRAAVKQYPKGVEVIDEDLTCAPKR